MNILFNLKNLFILAILLIVIGLSITYESSIMVEVKGEVKSPGVYEVTSEKRVEDILKLAELTNNSDTSQLNLSKNVYDEMVIIVPSKEEISSLKSSSQSYKLVENECVCPKLLNDSCAPVEVPKDEIVSNSKISLNNATKEELMTLPGIGESKALAIIEYRKQNRFNAIEEVMNVKGIGKSIYEKIKDSISL